ncbi:hypothetical protein [Adhaeretor mobilis]|uniref:Uncharacterized protein n=1 Tax=Adhaeretor mobilis TaxID=1930276 RepID=A0A517MX87_9BACT|nr:hypothetical protein [Adhaeretor mobilis]QDS99498.1 hypothetical protein HG15A2_28220 [Adhaeretor mobilis]
MATATTTSDRAEYRLQVNSYDRTATLLIAMLVMVGLTVLGLAVVFFANKFSTPVRKLEPVMMEASSPNANMGISDEPEPPGVQDAPELAEPQLQDTLDALTATISTNAAILSDQAIDAADQAGKGDGLGDSRQLGTGGDGVVERVPRWERWKIRFEPESVGAFTAWLDQYGIRVGVLGRDNQVHVAYDFNKGRKVESAPVKEYNPWGRTVPSDGPMPALTKQLASKAGIASRGRYILLFFPFSVEELLWNIEKEYRVSKGHDDVNDVRETVFTVLPKGGGYDFEVIDQKYF